MGFQNNAGLEPEAITNGSFEPLPDGVYEFVIYEIKQDVFKSAKNDGKPRLVVTLKIPTDAEKYVGRQITDFKVPFFTEEGNDWANRTAKNFFITGLGLDSFEDIPDDLDDLLGARIKAVLKTGKNQNDEAQNEIARYVPSDSEVKTAEPAVKKAPAKPAPGGKL